MNVLDQLMCLLVQVASSSATCSFQLHNSWLTRCCCCISSLQLLFVSLVKKLACVWRNMLHSPSSYLLLAILQLLQYSCRADAGSKCIFASNYLFHLNSAGARIFASRNKHYLGRFVKLHATIPPPPMISKY